MTSNLDDIIRGVIRGYGSSRGQNWKNTQTGAQVGQGNIGGHNARNRGKPGFPTGYNIANSANLNDDEGFQVQSEPLDEEVNETEAQAAGTTPNGEIPTEMIANVKENRWLRGIAAAGAIAAAQPTSDLPSPPRQERHSQFHNRKSDREQRHPPAPMTPPSVDSKKTIDDHIKEASHQTGVQPELIKAIMRAESYYDPTAVSPRGARGLMQLMPTTADEVGVDDPHDLRQGIIGGARYLQKLAHIYRGDVQRVIGAYNAGPGRISDIDPEYWPDETKEYLERVLRFLPDNFEKVRYKALKRGERKRRERIGVPAMREGGPIDRMTGNTDLSGKKEMTPELDDAERANIREIIASRVGGLIEARRTKVIVTGGRFQPFHRGHSAVIRALAAKAPKVIVFVDGSGPIDHQTTMDLMRASLPDIWSKLEIYPASGDLRSSAAALSGKSGSTMNQESNVIFQRMPGGDSDDDSTGQISGKRALEALQDDEKDSVRKMLDPHVSSQEAQFEELYGRMRRALGAAGDKTVEVVTDSPVPVRDGDLNEMGAGAMATTVGDTRTGRHGGSAWSSYNPRNKGADGDLYFQQMLRSPSTRMLDMTNSGTPNDHMPGDYLDHHLDDPNDPDTPKELKDPTDLSDMIVRRLRNIT
jgi:cytidyltransferase-like protein